MIIIGATVQNQEFFTFLSNFLGVKTDTLFTVSITLFVFSAGTTINLLVNFFKESQQRKNYKRTINLLLNDLARVCKKQHFVTISDLNSYSLIDGKQIGVKQMIYAPLQFLNKMDYSLFIKYYVRHCNKKQKIKAATKLFQIIGHTNIFEGDNEGKINLYLNIIKPLQETYIKHMLSLEVFGETLHKLEVSDYDFKSDLLKIFDSWNEKHTNNNFRNSFTNLVLPLIDCLKKYPAEAASTDLVSIIKECQFAYSEITHIDQIMKEHFKIFAYNNKSVYRNLEIILLILNNKKKKRNVFRRF